LRGFVGKSIEKFGCPSTEKFLVTLLMVGDDQHLGGILKKISRCTPDL
jgi:hypothetical protein